MRFLCWLVLTLPAAAQPVLLVQGAGGDPYLCHVRASLARRALTRAGLTYDVVTDLHLAEVEPGDRRLVMLPYNPNLPPAAVAWLVSFVNAGGKLLVAPPIPNDLAQLMGLRGAEGIQAVGDGLYNNVEFDQEFLPALPESWRQLDWARQTYTPALGTLVGARWRSPQPELDGLPALLLNGHGALLGAVLEGDQRNVEARLLLALATHYVRELWPVTVTRVLDDVGRIGSARGLDDVRRAAQAATRDDRRQWALKACDGAAERLAKARELLAAATAPPAPGSALSPPVERYLPAAELGFTAQAAAEQAWYLAQPGKADEFRGVWLQDASGIPQWDWLHTILALQEGRFNALFINVANGGYADYPSDVLPYVRGRSDDPLRDVIATCHSLGIECHAWLMTNYLRPKTPPEYRAQLEREGRLQVDQRGKTLGWLRPSDPRNRQTVAAVAAELARRYDLDGIQLDYLRYSPSGDYGDEERALFERASGRQLGAWPDDVAFGQPLRTTWTDWRRAQVDAELKTIVDAVRPINPDLKLSAAVYPIWADARLNVGQDPSTWARAGWVDFLCPMNYQTVDEVFYKYLTTQQRALGNAVPLYPGLAAWRHESPADTIAQVLALRERGLPGFVLFHLDRRLAREWLPALRLGLTAPLGPG